MWPSQNICTLLFVSDGDGNESFQSPQASKEETEKLIEQILLDIIYKVVGMDEKNSDVDGKESIQSPLESTEEIVQLNTEDVVNQVAGAYETVPNQIEGEGRQASL